MSDLEVDVDVKTAARAPGAGALLEHMSFVRRVALDVARHPDDAEDLAQESLLEALEHPAPDGRRLRPWMVGIVRNLGLARRRQRARLARRERSAARADAVVVPNDARVLEQERRAGIVKLVMSLEPAYRDVIVLRHVHGLPPADVARRLGVPVATVKTRLQRARATLRRRLEVRRDRRPGVALLSLAAGRARVGRVRRLALVSAGVLKVAAVIVGLVLAGVSAEAVLDGSEDEVALAAPGGEARRGLDRPRPRRTAGRPASVAHDERRPAPVPVAVPGGPVPVPTARRLDVRVFDVTSGDPIPGAQVRFVPHEAASAAGRLDLMRLAEELNAAAADTEGVSASVATTISLDSVTWPEVAGTVQVAADDDGHATAALVPGRRYEMVATTSGYVAVRRAAVVPDGGVEVGLTPGATLRLRRLGPGGRRLCVSLRPGGAEPDFRVVEPGARELVVDSLPAGPCEVHVFEDLELTGASSAIVPRRSPTFQRRVELETGRETVVDLFSGGCEVAVALNGGGDRELLEVFLEPARASPPVTPLIASREGGLHLFRHVEPGAYRLLARRRCVSLAQSEIVVAAGRARTEVALEIGGSSLRVHGDPRLRVWLEAGGGRRISPPRKLSGGSCLIEGLVPGRYVLWYGHEHRYECRPVWIDGRSTETGVRLGDAPGVELRLRHAVGERPRVVPYTPGGVPLARGGGVVITASAEGFLVAASEPAGGIVAPEPERVWSLPRGRYRLSIRSGEGDEVARTVELDESRTIRVGSPRGILVTLVLRRERLPMTHAAVALSRLDLDQLSGPPRHGWTDELGQVRFRLVEGARYRLTSAGRSAEVEVGAGAHRIEVEVR